MRVIDIINTAVVHAGVARSGAVPNDLFDHALELLNFEYHKLWHLYPWDQIKKFDVQVTTIAGIATLPNNIDIVRAVRDGDRTLRPVHENRVNNDEPESFDDTGDRTERFMFIDLSPVLKQPATPSLITVVSSDPLDLTQIVRLEGVNNATGKDDEEEIALNGTSDKTSVKVFRSLSEITKGLTKGRITVKDAGSVELGDIAPWDHKPEYRRLQLVPKPVNQLTLTIIGTRRFERLVSDNDSITIPKLSSAVFDLLIGRLKETQDELEQSSFYTAKAADEIEVMGRNEIEQNNRQIKATPASGDFGEIDFVHSGVHDPRRKTF